MEWGLGLQDFSVVGLRDDGSKNIIELYQGYGMNPPKSRAVSVRDDHKCLVKSQSQLNYSSMGQSQHVCLEIIGNRVII